MSRIENSWLTNQRFVMLSMLRIFDSGIRESKDSHYSIYVEGWEC